MFKLIKTDTFAAPVHVSLPTADATKRNEGSFTAHFKQLDKTQVSDLLEGLKRGDITDEDVLDRVLVKVSGIGDDEGNSLPEAEQLIAVRNSFGLASATAVAFFREVGSAAEKNASRSRGR